MTKTPWHWIITAYIFAVLFLVTFGYYRNEANSNNASEVVQLKKDIQDKDNQIASKDKLIADRDNQIASKDKLIAKLNWDLAYERSREPSATTPTTPDNNEARNLQQIITGKQKTIDRQADSIRTLNATIEKLQKKIEYFRNAPK